MSKFTRFIAIAALIVGALAMTPGPAAAQRHGGHGGHHGGGWHGGGGHGGGWHGGGGWRGGGWGWGPGFVWGFGGPYYDGYYYDEPGDCGWVRVRVWRNHHRVWRRAWRCW